MVVYANPFNGHHFTVHGALWAQGASSPPCAPPASSKHSPGHADDRNHADVHNYDDSHNGQQHSSLSGQLPSLSDHLPARVFRYEAGHAEHQTL